MMMMIDDETYLVEISETTAARAISMEVEPRITKAESHGLKGIRPSIKNETLCKRCGRDVFFTIKVRALVLVFE